MQRIIISLIIGFTYLLPAFCQIEPAGLIEVSLPRIYETENMVHIEMDILIKEEAMSKRQSWSIRPVLIEKDNEVNTCYLPYILVKGKMKQNHFKRRKKFEDRNLLDNYPDYQINSPLNKDTLLTYTVEVPFEYWMKNANLFLYQTLASSAGKEQCFIMPVDGLVSLKDRDDIASSAVMSYEREGKQYMRKEKVTFFYRTNFSEVESAWSINPLELSRLADTLSELQVKPGANIREIEICGYASPDGPFDTNQKLAQKRADELKSLLVQSYGLPKSLITTKSVPEDWANFRAIVAETEVPNREQIYSIIDSNEEPEFKEKTLKKLPGTWQLVKDVFLPLLRRVELTIIYSSYEEI